MMGHRAGSGEEDAAMSLVSATIPWQVMMMIMILIMILILMMMMVAGGY